MKFLHTLSLCVIVLSSYLLRWPNFRSSFVKNETIGIPMHLNWPRVINLRAASIFLIFLVVGITAQPEESELVIVKWPFYITVQFTSQKNKSQTKGQSCETMIQATCWPRWVQIWMLQELKQRLAWWCLASTVTMPAWPWRSLANAQLWLEAHMIGMYTAHNNTPNSWLWQFDCKKVAAPCCLTAATQQEVEL